MSLLLYSRALTSTQRDDGDADKPVVDADTVVDIRAVVIKRQHTAITLPTVFSSQRLHSLTRVTQPTQRV